MTDDIASRWMPPSPHREAILKFLDHGRAHLEPRGHNRSPLLVFEDGGAMELAHARLVDGMLVAVRDATAPEATTRHTDVCGTIDELKRLWADGAADGPEQLALLDHALTMLARMGERLEAYRDFTTRLAALAGDLAALQHPDHTPAPMLADQLRERIATGAASDANQLEHMNAVAEQIRDIASASEQVLYPYRDLAIEVGRLYEEIRGAREWSRTT